MTEEIEADQEINRNIHHHQDPAEEIDLTHPREITLMTDITETEDPTVMTETDVTVVTEIIQDIQETTEASPEIDTEEITLATEIEEIHIALEIEAQATIDPATDLAQTADLTMIEIEMIQKTEETPCLNSAEDV